MTLEPSTPVALFQTRIAGAANTVGLNYNVTRDGRFLIVTGVSAHQDIDDYTSDFVSVSVELMVTR